MIYPVDPLDLLALVQKWRAAASAAVPPEYADRDMHHKYLRMDNHAAGLDDCADDLHELLTKGKS